MLDHFIATKNATAHKVNSYYTLAISYCTFCVGKHTILGPAVSSSFCLSVRLRRLRVMHRELQFFCHCVDSGPLAARLLLCELLILGYATS